MNIIKSIAADILGLVVILIDAYIESFKNVWPSKKNAENFDLGELVGSYVILMVLTAVLICILLIPILAARLAWLRTFGS